MIHLILAILFYIFYLPYFIISPCTSFLLFPIVIIQPPQDLKSILPKFHCISTVHVLISLLCSCSWQGPPLPTNIRALKMNRLEESPQPYSWFHFKYMVIINLKGLTGLSGSHTLVFGSFPPPFSQTAILYLFFCA